MQNLKISFISLKANVTVELESRDSNVANVSLSIMDSRRKVARDVIVTPSAQGIRRYLFHSFCLISIIFLRLQITTMYLQRTM